ncbi:MAG TPA: glutaredoxin family protein [Chloroflexota bacterium]
MFLWPFHRRPMRRVTVYGKPNCHLCEEALDLLTQLGRRLPMEIQEVDITTDPILFRRYDVIIPVIVIDGETELSAPIQEADLRRALSRRSPRS